jgi:MbtH protein
MSTSDTGELWVVVVNDEEQYSIWRVSEPVPAGWKACGQPGARDHCLAYIDTVWTDLRPRLLREALARAGR